MTAVVLLLKNFLLSKLPLDWKQKSDFSFQNPNNVSQCGKLLNEVKFKFHIPIKKTKSLKKNSTSEWMICFDPKEPKLDSNIL